MRRLARSRGPIVAALVCLAAPPATALDRVILGARLVVKDPGGGEPRRSIVAVAKERLSDVPAVSDPTGGGALLTVAIDGATSTAQTYVLDAAGWSPAGTAGYRYTGPTGSDADPVKKVVLQRRANGTALVKVAIRGSVGTQSLDVVPPNPGSQGSLVLDVAGGDRYCTALGGAAGGAVRNDTSAVWKIVAATAEVGCPITTSTTTSTTSTTAPPVCGNGTVEPPEECEPSVVPGPCFQIPDVGCGAAGGPVECQCCVVPGGAVKFIVGEPVCCDGSPCNLPVPFVCECPP